MESSIDDLMQRRSKLLEVIARAADEVERIDSQIKAMKSEEMARPVLRGW